MKAIAKAKINLNLRVFGVRMDGYHDLQSVVMPIPLADEVSICKAQHLEVKMSVLGDHPSLVGVMDLPAEKNLALRVARLLQAVTGCDTGAFIHIGKHIPLGAGLGGGSADAACVLRALNKLWKLGLSCAELCEIGARVGSDVPALVLGAEKVIPNNQNVECNTDEDFVLPNNDQLVMMEGRGERVRPFGEYPMPDCSQLVVRTPPVFASTPKVFAEFRDEDRGLGENDLQPAACRLYSQITEALEDLRKQGCVGVMMSGSGSSVFGWRSE